MLCFKTILFLFMFLGSENYMPKKENANQLDYFEISGVISTYDNTPIDSCLVQIRNKKNEILYSTHTNEKGEYLLNIPKGKYACLIAVREDAYLEKTLEFWCWNIILTEDRVINGKCGKMEVYAVNIFKEQYGVPGYLVYFRPMSLTRFKNMKEKDSVSTVMPDLKKNDVKVTKNGIKLNILSIRKMELFLDESTKLYAYIVHVESDTLSDQETSYFEIEVIDEFTKDIGMASYYFNEW